MMSLWQLNCFHNNIEPRINIVKVKIMDKAVINLAASFGNTIKVSRRARKIKQADLASMAGIGMNSMVAIERGETTVQLGFYLQVLNALGISDILKPIIDNTVDKLAIAAMASTLPQRVVDRARSRHHY